MHSLNGSHCRETRRATDHIRHTPAANFHHGIRLAESKGFPLNLLTTINFAQTDCPEHHTDRAFQHVRGSYQKWVTRPRKAAATHKAPPTFVWVIENGNVVGLHAHWLLHVPSARQSEFRDKLPEWLESVVGQINSAQTIDIRPAYNPKGLEMYLLKGMYPSQAQSYGICP